MDKVMPIIDKTVTVLTVQVPNKPFAIIVVFNINITALKLGTR
ncbi:MAG: hypothetical protein ACI8RD_007005 [Bacillariaceae sp.]|jgi:hypothetical protein